MVVQGVMWSPDGRWSVQAVRRGREFWYRVLDGEEVVADHLVIGSLPYVLLEQCGIELADLVDR